MSYFKIRECANRVREIPLEAVLLSLGAERDRHDKAKWHMATGMLSVTGNKFMDWSQGHGGGGAIDLVIHLCGFDFLNAVEWLSRHFPAAGSPRGAPRPQPSVQTLRLPSRDDGKLRRVEHYLLSDRLLPISLVQSLIHAGTLYADSSANAVFLLLGNGSTPVGAELRGTSRHRQWRGMAPGSRKDAGYFAVPSPDATAVVLCESAIDAISCAALHPHLLCVSTSGARSNPKWLPRLVSSRDVYCGFDADTTGDRIAKSMMARYPTVQRFRPLVHDWNDTLIAEAF